MIRIVSLLFLLSLLFSSEIQAGSSLNFEPCRVSKGARIVKAECADFVQPLNPEQADGETITLSVAKFKARSSSPAKDALTIIQGGPGMSSIDLFLALETVFQKTRRDRDILVIDQRGTGRSNMLRCDSLNDANEIELNIENTKRLAKECVAELGEQLKYYTTSVAVKDLEALRKAAGYEQLTIYGVSYGTRVAQHYLRMHPQQTRALIIDGVADVKLNLAGGEIAIRSQQAFDLINKDCKDTPSCFEKHGDLQQKFDAIRNHLKETPTKVSFAHPTTGANTTEEITELHLLGIVRMLPYSTESRALLPLVLSNAFNGDYSLIASLAAQQEETFKDYSVAMNNSVVCTEDAPFVKEHHLQGLEKTYFGDDFYKNIAAACEVWPKGLIDENFHQPIESDVPVLILSGENDPITSPENGDKTDKMLNNSKHLVVSGQGHGVISRGCVPELVSRFIKDTDFEKLNTQCINRSQAQPLFLDATGAKP